MSLLIARLYLGATALLIAVVNFFSWEQIEALLKSLPYRCPLNHWLKLQCAFCGMTHSWIHLFRGEFAQSFQQNILGPPLWLGSIGLSIAVLLKFRINSFNKKTTVWITSLILVLYAILRNF